MKLEGGNVMSEVMLIKFNFNIRKPFTRDELSKVLNISNNNTFNQKVSNLINFGIIKKWQGIYYLPEKKEKFKDLKPSISDVVNKKYLDNLNGIRTGSYLLYKYKFTSQVSNFYEIITNNVSKQTRSRKLFDGNVIVSSSLFDINEDNFEYIVFIELLKNIKYSDLNHSENVEKLSKLFIEFKLDKNILREMLKLYQSQRSKMIKVLFEEVINYETTSE